MLGLIENVLTKDSNEKVVKKKTTFLYSNIKGWILDGYPRTLKQADDLSSLLSKIKQPIDIVFYLKVSEDVLWERVKGKKKVRIAVYSQIDGCICLVEECIILFIRLPRIQELMTSQGNHLYRDRMTHW
jgi:hypothetical protein